MFGNNSYLSPLAVRKRLLIAESELNRAHLAEDWRTMGQGAYHLGHRFTTVGACVSSLALVVTGIAAWRRRPLPAPAARFPWLQKLLHGASVASTIWLASQGSAGRLEQRRSSSNDALASRAGVSARYETDRARRS
jgi:hypothetical protein